MEPLGVTPSTSNLTIAATMPRIPAAPRAGVADRQRTFMDALGRHGMDVGVQSARPTTVNLAAAPDAKEVEASLKGLDPKPDARGHAGSRDDPARRAAEQFVAATFIQPILKDMRAQNHAQAPFGPTEAEKTLGPLMDAQLADRMVRSHQFGIVERIASDLRKRAQATQPTQPRDA